MTDPKWDPPAGPKGYGDPHRPAGGFSVETKALIDASHTWDDVASALHTVWNYAKVGWGTEGLFGALDTLYSAGKIQSGINEDLVNAAEDGYAIVTGLANGLVEVANDYENTDTTQGDKLPPDHKEGLMGAPKADSNPDVFLEQVNELIDKVTDAVYHFTLRVATWIDDHGKWLALLGGVLGGLTYEALVDRFDKWCENVWNTWYDAMGKIYDAIGKILGNPLLMTKISSAYKDAVTTIGNVKSQVDNADAYIANSWKGPAYVAYSNTSNDQQAALQGMSDMLGDAADLLDDNCLNLLKYWTQQLKNIYDLEVDIGKATVDAVEIEDVATLGTKGAAQLALTAAKDAGQIVQDTANYWLDLNVGSAGDWDSLQSKFGDRGLPNRQWPDIAAIDKGPINGPWTKA